LGSLYSHQEKILSDLRGGASYICAAPRCGKTRPVISFCDDLDGDTLVLTKKAAVSGWLSELEAMGVSSGFFVTNYEQVKTKGWDQSIRWGNLVCDEAHTLGTYPRPNQLVKPIRALDVAGLRIGVSATPCPESYSQLFHQDKALRLGLWDDCSSFYQWHKRYGIPDMIRVQGRLRDTYKKVRESVWRDFQRICSITDRQVVMPDFVEAEDILVPIEAPEVLEMCRKLKKDEVLEIDGHFIVADSPMALAQKSQQICAGVVLDDAGVPVQVNSVKASWISKRFKGVKTAILTTFRAEVDSLGGEGSQEAFLAGFEDWFVGNFSKYSSGVDLSPAEALVFTGCPWSCLHFWQGRDRILNVKREKPAPVYFPVIKGGIDEMIFNRVAVSKADFVAKLYA